VFKTWLIKLQSMDRPVSYCIAVAIAAAVAGVPLRAALIAYYHAVIANLVSAGLRLIPLGQIAGQRTIEALRLNVIEAVDGALDQPIGDLGTATPMIDLMSMKHENQYTRLFRS
jgi:urease accessory protein